jgi:CHASE3 domain sensor protein
MALQVPGSSMSSIGKVNAALAAAIIFLLLSSASAYLAFHRMNTNESWVRHTRDVQSALAQFSTATARAGRLRAEYVDSGEPSLLQQQAEAVRQIRNTVTVLQRVTADNPQQQVNCRKLAELKEQRIALMEEAAELKRSGKSSLAAQAEITRQSLAVAELSDLLLQRMNDTEEQLLAERQTRAASSTEMTAAVLIVSLWPGAVVVYRASPLADGSGNGALPRRTGTAHAQREAVNAAG